MHPLAPVVVPFNRLRFLITEPRRLDVLEKTITAMRERHSSLSNDGLHDLAQLYNVALFVLLVERDIAHLKQDALFAVRQSRKTWTARQLAVLLYEITEDLPELFGGRFRRVLADLPLAPAELESLNSGTKALARFKQNHAPKLKHIRNYVGAHREQNVAEQLDVLEQIDLSELLVIAGGYYEIIGRLHPTITRLLELTGDPRVIGRHMSVAHSQRTESA